MWADSSAYVNAKLILPFYYYKFDVVFWFSVIKNKCEVGVVATLTSHFSNTNQLNRFISCKNNY